MNTKRFIIFLVLGLLVGSPLAAGSLTVSRISVAGTETTNPQLVRDAFLEVRVGDTLTEADLETAAGLVRDRLKALGYFSSVDVLVIRSKTKPGTATLVAEVAEGFTGRYGGGPLWGRFGAVNLGGAGQDADLWLGWNRQAAGWSGRFAGFPGWTLGAEGGNRPQTRTGTDGIRREDHAMGASASAAQDWGWGWSTGLGFEANGIFDSAYQNPEYRAGPRGWVEWSRRTPEFSAVGVLVRLEASTVLPGDLVRYGADLRAAVPLGGGFKAAFRAVGLTQTGAFGERDTLVLTDLGVRKLWDRDDRGPAAAWASAELRWEVAKWDLFGFTTLTLEPALIADFSPAWTAGGALRAFVGAPVSLPLQLEATLDQHHRFWLGFSASAPY